jgi:hypothetical protein
LDKRRRGHLEPLLGVTKKGTYLPFRNFGR